MAANFWEMLGVNVGSSLLSFAAADQKASAERAWQAYHNKMVRLSDANNQNAISDNEIMTMKAYSDQALDIKKDNLKTAAGAEVAAAAAGVKGRSVNQVVFDINRNASVAEAHREDALSNAFLGFDKQRQASAFQDAMQQDHSYIPTPSLASAILGGVSDSMKYWTPTNQAQFNSWLKPQTSPSSGGSGFNSTIL